MGVMDLLNILNLKERKKAKKKKNKILRRWWHSNNTFLAHDKHKCLNNYCCIYNKT